MAGAGHNGFGGDEDYRSGGITDRRGRGYGQDRNGVGLNRSEDNVAHITLGTESNAPLAYGPRLELNHPIMSKLGDPRARLDIYIYIYISLLDMDFILRQNLSTIWMGCSISNSLSIFLHMS